MGIEIPNGGSSSASFDLTGHAVLRVNVLRLSTPLWLGADTGELSAGVEQRYYEDKGDIIHTVETPVGALTWRLRFAPESPFCPWIVENRIRTVEDVKTFQYLIERTRCELWTELLRRKGEKVGQRGLVAILGPCSLTVHCKWYGR